MILPAMTSLLAFALLLAPSATDDALVPPQRPAIGSETVVATGLLVTRPATKPCIVELFAEREFRGEARVPIAYRPPAECAGPWAKVVFEGDFRVTAGEQFDRTGFITLAGVNLFTGTTMEPRKALAPTWHVERDVSDYAAVFARPQTGEALLTNYVDARYTGQVFWTGRLIFYPVATSYTGAAPDTPDLVEALTLTPGRIDAGTPSITRALTFPRNITRLMIDVLAQPQAADEFWWICQVEPTGTPVDPKKEQGCGRPFRDVEVLIDGRLAGFAAAYPWIYTGGVNPRMWTLTPGIETLDLSPTRIDLTPFAALVNDGKPHAITVRVVGVQSYFFAMGTVLGWRDAGRAVVAGELDVNTLASARVTLTGKPAASEAERFGDTVTVARRAGRLVGHVITSRGRVTTAVDYRMVFGNTQRGSSGGGRIEQRTDIKTRREIRGPDGTRRHSVIEAFPLLVEMTERPEGRNRVSDTHFRQGLTRIETSNGVGRSRRRSKDMLVEPRIHMIVPPSGRRDAIIQATTITTTAVRDDASGCYNRMVEVLNGRILAVHDGCS